MDEEIKEEVKEDFRYRKSGIKFLIAGILVGTFLTALAFISVIIVKNYKTKALINSIYAETNRTVVPDSSSEKAIDAGFYMKMQTIESVLKYYSIYDIDWDDIKNQMLKTLLKTTKDKYAEYYTPQEYTSLTSKLEGSFFGIGVTITLDPESEEPSIISVIEGSSAEKAGIKEGDIIVAADGTVLKGMDLNLAVSYIKGEEGTYVLLTVYRPSTGETKEINIERCRVESQSVAYGTIEDNIGYIIISSFADSTVQQFKDAYLDLKTKGIEGLIIDLRQNPGGVTDASCDILSTIIPKGELLVRFEGTNGIAEEYKSTGGKVKVEVPIVVLVDENTASASEIFAGAIKSYKAGVIVGKKTYGKGIAQSIYPLSSGDAIKYTIAKFYIPSGECIHEIGIEPDVEVDYDFEAASREENPVDTQMEKGIEVLKGMIKK